MSSPTHGSATSRASVEGVTPFGLWLLADGSEHFLPFAEFPFFRKASIDDLLYVELHGAAHLSWPALDVDLELDSVRHPERYPLVERRPAASRKGPTGRRGRRAP